MIEDLNKKLDKFIIIPNSPITEASRNIRSLDQALKVVLEEEQPKVETLKAIATWRPRDRDGLLNPNQGISLIQNSYNGNNIYEWNIDGKFEYEIIKIL